MDQRCAVLQHSEWPKARDVRPDVSIVHLTPMPPPRLLLLILGLLLGTSSQSLRAEDPQCQTLLAQAQEMLSEAEAQTLRGQEAKAEGVARRALPLVDRAFGLCPDSRDAAGLGVLLATFAREIERGELWLARYQELTPYGERDPQLHYFRAVVEVRLISRPDLAVRSLERMQALAPTLHTGQRDTLYYEALMLRGTALRAEGRYPEALRLFQSAERVAQRAGKTARERRARAMVGITYDMDARHKEAAQVFRQLHEEDPTSPVWPYQLGLSLAQLLDYEGAIKAYRISIERQQGYHDSPAVLDELLRTRLRLGNCLRLSAGRMSPEAPQREELLVEALAQLTRYRELRPNDPLGPLWTGVLYYEERNQPLIALGWFEKAFALDPECETTLEYLIQGHNRAGGPVPPDAPEPSEAELQAWRAKGEAWRKDKTENADRRKKLLDARVRATGDQSGGCL